MGNQGVKCYKGMSIKVNNENIAPECQDAKQFNLSLKHLDDIMKNIRRPHLIKVNSLEVILGSILIGSFNFKQFKDNTQDHQDFLTKYMGHQKEFLEDFKNYIISIQNQIQKSNLLKQASSVNLQQLNNEHIIDKLDKMIQGFNQNFKTQEFLKSPFYFFGEFLKYMVFHLYLLFLLPGGEDQIIQLLPRYFEDGVTLFKKAMEFRLDHVQKIEYKAEKLIARGLSQEIFNTEFFDTFNESHYSHTYTGYRGCTEEKIFFCFRAEYEIKILKIYSKLIKKYLKYLQIFSNYVSHCQTLQVQEKQVLENQLQLPQDNQQKMLKSNDQNMRNKNMSQLNSKKIKARSIFRIISQLNNPKTKQKLNLPKNVQQIKIANRFRFPNNTREIYTDNSQAYQKNTTNNNNLYSQDSYVKTDQSNIIYNINLVPDQKEQNKGNNNNTDNNDSIKQDKNDNIIVQQLQQQVQDTVQNSNVLSPVIRRNSQIQRTKDRKPSFRNILKNSYQTNMNFVEQVTDEGYLEILYKGLFDNLYLVHIEDEKFILRTLFTRQIIKVKVNGKPLQRGSDLHPQEIQKIQEKYKQQRMNSSSNNNNNNNNNQGEFVDQI